jgi:hypothetical protein
MLFSCQVPKGAPLRNYIKVLAMDWFLDLSDGVDNVSLQAAEVASTPEELLSRIEIRNEINLAAWPGFGIVNDTSKTQTPDNVYVCLDRFNVVSFLQTLDLINYRTSVNNRFFLINPSTSPRYSGWKDENNVQRPVAPTDSKRKRLDFRGAPGLIEALQGFLKLASDLTALNEVRKAGIVLYAYNQVIKQVWSITQAIQYLIDNRITATV